MTDPGRTYDYPPTVRLQIHDETIGDYVDAAEFLNNAGFDIVSLQHEYGIFGGEAGRNIIELISRLEMPIVTTLHTVLLQPTPIQRDVCGTPKGTLSHRSIKTHIGWRAQGVIIAREFTIVAF
jgi:hypothetical protein